MCRLKVMMVQRFGFEVSGKQGGGINAYDGDHVFVITIIVGNWLPRSVHITPNRIRSGSSFINPMALQE